MIVRREKTVPTCVERICGTAGSGCCSRQDVGRSTRSWQV